MKEQFVDYKTAKKLQELGFKDKCIATINNIEVLHIKGTKNYPSAAVVDDKVDCPLWQQVAQWLSTKGYYPTVEIFKESNEQVHNMSFDSIIVVDDDIKEEEIEVITFITYWDAYTDAVLSALELYKENYDKRRTN